MGRPHPNSALLFKTNLIPVPFKLNGTGRDGYDKFPYSPCLTFFFWVHNRNRRERAYFLNWIVNNEDWNRRDPWSIMPTAAPPSRTSQPRLALNSSERWHWAATWSTVALHPTTVQRHSYLRAGPTRSSEDKAPLAGP